MWFHIILFIGFCIVFFCAKGLFSKSGKYLAKKIPVYYQLNHMQIRLMLMAVFWGNLIGFLITLCSGGGEVLHTLKREDKPYEEVLYVTDGEHEEKFTVEIGIDPYTEEEKQKILELAAKELPKWILGQNETLERIEYPLDLITVIPDTDIFLQWNTNQPLILDWEGTIGEEVPKEGTKVLLQAEMHLEDSLYLYETEVVVYPQKLSDQDTFVAQVEKQLQENNKKSGGYMELPSFIGGTALHWSRPNDMRGIWLTAFTIVLSVLLVFVKASRKKEAEKKQQQAMIDAYPNILNKLILLMRAGMSSRRAIQKIALDYKLELDEGKEKRPAYEAVLQMYRELEHGVSEEEVYRNLGNHYPLLCYRSLSTLLIQNLKKGSSQFLHALKMECNIAFEDRKNRALIRGEEAGTKLLIPMVCMLLIVLLIILIPSMLTIG